MWFFWLLLDAAVLGVIIAAMEEGDFPDWWRVIVCALGTAFGVYGAASALVPLAGKLGAWLALFIGALIGGLLISALCSMSVKRASIAAGIFLAFKIVVGMVFLGLLTS